jgi:Sulfatase
MEVFAAALSYADAQFGRILDALQASGEFENTLVIITSDNGASAEGGPDGLYNEAEVTSPQLPDVAKNMAFYDDWGGPRTYPHYSYGWAVAGDTPFRYYKQTTHEGGTRVPLVIAWQRGIAARGELRNQFVHVSDIAPTILDAVAVAPARTINDVVQSAMEGQSVKESFLAAGDPRAGRAQYVELYGNKGLWWQGWLIVTNHRFKTWDWHTSKTFDEPWELYDLVSDPGQNHNLAAQQTQRVKKMSGMFDEQARRFHVCPIHNLSDSYADSFVKARANFESRGGKWRYAGAVGNIPQALAPPVNSRSFTMTANLDLPTSDITGPVFAYGGQLGGMGFYLKDGKPMFIMNALSGQSVLVAAPEGLDAGATKIQLVVEKGAVAQDGTAEYHIIIKSTSHTFAEATVHFAIPAFFGIGEVFGVGTDDGSAVLANYSAGTPLPARISSVLFDFSFAGHAGRSDAVEPNRSARAASMKLQ